MRDPFTLTQGVQRDHKEHVPSHFGASALSAIYTMRTKSRTCVCHGLHNAKRCCPRSFSYRKQRHVYISAQKQRAFFFLTAHLQRWNSFQNFRISHIVAPLSHICSLSAAFSPFSHLWNAFSRSSSYFPLPVVRTFIRSQLFPYFTPCQPQVLAELELRSA